MTNRILVAAMLLSTAGSAWAADLDVNLSNDTAQIGVSSTLDSQLPDRSRVGGAVLFNDDHDVVGSGFFHVIGNLTPGYKPLQFGAGVKAYLADLDSADDTVGALAISGLVRLSIPQTAIPLAVVVEGEIAPKITSFKSDGVDEVIGRVEARFARHATAYIGYRYLKFELENAPDRKVDDGFLVGLRMSF